MLKNATVTLSYRVPGVQLQSGEYEYHERTSSGGVLEEDRRLFIQKRPKYAECYVSVKLSEQFVNFAISEEGRPKRNDSLRAYSAWKTMSEEERLKWHLAKYVESRGSSDFNYAILEE